MLSKYPFSVEKVDELIKKGYSQTQIVKTLAPEYGNSYYYKWTSTLSKEERAKIKMSHKSNKTYVPQKIDRSFKYKETPENTILPKRIQ
jgi:hypothetical protein